MNFVTDLPLSEGNDSILVVVNHLTKMHHFLPTIITASAADVAELYVWNIFKLHGFSKTVVSD